MDQQLDKNSDSDELPSIDLRRYLRLLYKRRWVVLATLAISLTVTVFWTLRQPNLYVASASVVIDPKSPNVMSSQFQEIIQLGAGGMWWNEDYYNTQVEILQTRKLAEMTAQVPLPQGHLYDNEKLLGPEAMKLDKQERVNRVASIVSNALAIKDGEQSRIFRIEMTHSDPEIAAIMANAHVQAYESYTLGLRHQGAQKATKNLASNLDDADLIHEKAEAAILDFEVENDITEVSLTEAQERTSRNIDRYSQAASDAKLRLNELAAMRKQLLQIQELDPLESPVFKLTGNQTGDGLKRQYYDQLANLNALAATHAEKAPEVIKQKEILQGIRQALTTEANVAIAAVNREYMQEQQKLDAHKADLVENEGKSKELKKLAPDYNRMAREKERALKARNEWDTGKQSSEMTGALQTTNIRPLDVAVAPSSPAFPRMDRNLALAGALGLLLGVLFAFTLEYFDRTIKTSADVETHVGSPVLGIIPLHPSREKLADNNSLDLLVHREPASAASECCRHIRTNLLFASADNAFETMVVTSANPRDGKSTTVMYLATTFAQSGQRVLVIDSDMRRPRLHRSVGVARTIGLSNLIVGESTIEDTVKTTEVPNLYFLPCGPTPPNPAELLMTDRFKQVLADLKSRFDRIILDSPPILAVTDAMVMSRMADGVVLVLKAGSTTREAAIRSRRQLADVDARVAGVILNELDMSDKSYGYYNYYHGYESPRGEAADAV